MNTMFLLLLAVILFVGYNAAILTIFGVPESLSNTFYLLNDKKKYLGTLFTIMMFAMAFMMMPAWLDLTIHATEWSHNLLFLPFWAGAGIAFVGAAPLFKDSLLEGNVHRSGAGIAALASILWDFIVCSQYWYLVVGTLIVVGIISLITKTLKTGWMYWLEMVAFYGTFLTIFAQYLF